MSETVASDLAPADLLARARQKDRRAFDRLMEAERPRLERVVRRLVGHPDQVDDIVQDTLLKAFESIGSFRGDSKLSTWLHSIATRKALDHLRKHRTWRADAQVFAQLECGEVPEKMARVMSVLEAPDFEYDVREHVAYCFTCVSRSLTPDLQAALILRDAMDMSNREAADALGITQSVLRHRLAEARGHMQDSFDHLCALVSKEGVCYQCAGLRDRVRPEGQGEPSEGLLDGADRESKYGRRLRIVQEADVHSGASQRLHDMFFRQLFDLEERRTSDERAPRSDVPSCGR